ncbi:MAG: hypothetical protein HQL51_05985 [Magnetococcales bacterium]|nr:hypothetical protein [Magnetococcales bacterium]
MIALTLPQEAENRLQELAHETGRSVEECLKEAAFLYLEAMEERRDAADARVVLEEHRRAPGAPFTLDDALERYGLRRETLGP